MATSYNIYQEDIEKLYWDEVYAKPDYDPEKEIEYTDEIPDLKDLRSSNFDFFNRYIRKYIPDIRHGDTVQIGGQMYRNENLQFWHKTKGLIFPDFESGTDYGTVPSDFRVGNDIDEFAPRHWVDVIEYYDGLIWLSDDLISEVHTTLTCSINNTYTTTVMIDNIVYTIESMNLKPTKFEIGPTHFIYAT
jgi:hypothetical protein